MDTKTFAQKLKEKYPDYQNIGDAVLVQKVVEKYPVYKNKITDYSNDSGILKSVGKALTGSSQALGKSAGETFASPFAIKKFNEAVKSQQEISSDIVTAIKNARTLGQDTTRLENALRMQQESIPKLEDFLGEKANTLIEATPGKAAEIIGGEALGTALEATSGGVLSGAKNIAMKPVTESIARKLGRGAAVGAAYGGLTGTAEGMAKGESAGQVAKQASIGTAIGGALGAGIEAIPAVVAGTRVAGKKLTSAAGTAQKTVGEIVKDTPGALAKFVSPDIDPKFVTALKKTTKNEVDSMESVVKNAIESADNPSAFEVVGNKLADATEQVSNQVKSLVSQKKQIIAKAKNGLVDFKKETGNTILEINRSLKDSKLAKSFISRLKKVNTKLDADNAIDELQDILYKGNKDMTIPVGSKEDKVLKGIIGKYNAVLKNGLPASYKKLNETISNKLGNLELLNSSLGEVVEGVPIRGASLIKQYFSPSGTKAKELFEFIQKNTGYDVGKDAVLAKYLSEIYGETRARSFLQGVSTTAQGNIDKLLEFALEKTGVAGKIKNLSRKGQVLKAKSIAK